VFIEFFLIMWPKFFFKTCVTINGSMFVATRIISRFTGRRIALLWTKLKVVWFLYAAHCLFIELYNYVCNF
jgi:hypothetical protein